MKKVSSKTFHRKLGYFKKIPEILGFDGKFLAFDEIAKVRRFLVKNCKRSALNNPHENTKFQKTSEMLGFGGEFPAVIPKAKFCRFLVKN